VAIEAGPLQKIDPGKGLLSMGVLLKSCAMMSGLNNGCEASSGTNELYAHFPTEGVGLEEFVEYDKLESEEAGTAGAKEDEDAGTSGGKEGENVESKEINEDKPGGGAFATFG